MGQGPRFGLGLHRHREGKTDYRQRLKLIKSGKPRAVVRRSNRNTQVQLVLFDPDGDRIEASAGSRELAEHGWTGPGSNCPASYLTGYLAGQRAVEAGLEEAVLDIGESAPSPGSNVFAVLQGLVDAGVEIPHGEEVVPAEERLRGEHIDEETVDEFETVKDAITGGS